MGTGLVGPAQDYSVVVILGVQQVLQAIDDGVVDIRLIAVLLQEPGHGMAQGCRCLDKEDLAHGAGSWLRPSMP